MNDLDELRQHVLIHARTQDLADAVFDEVLGRVTHDGDGPGSWAHEWGAAATERERAGDPVNAGRLYTIGRFPYVDGPGRQSAQYGAVRAFTSWAQSQPGLRPLEIDLPGGRVRVWTAGLSATRPLPLLVVMGGIVSTKEQWAPVLSTLAPLGVAGVVAEFPGVGENTLTYDAESWRLFPALLDALDGQARVDETYLMTLSFSGHLALRAAGEDRRIRGIVASGTPISRFFTDRAWLAGVPRVTVNTIAHLTGVDPVQVPDHIRGWALTPAQLEAVRVPVSHVVSLRDEIIPVSEVDLLRQYIATVSLLEIDDVHGCPAHSDEVRLWTAVEMQRMRGAGGAGTAMLAAALAQLRAAQASGARPRVADLLNPDRANR